MYSGGTDTNTVVVVVIAANQTSEKGGQNMHGHC